MSLHIFELANISIFIGIYKFSFFGLIILEFSFENFSTFGNVLPKNFLEIGSCFSLKYITILVLD